MKSEENEAACVGVKASNCVVDNAAACWLVMALRAAVPKAVVAAEPIPSMFAVKIPLKVVGFMLAITSALKPPICASVVKEVICVEVK